MRTVSRVDGHGAPRATARASGPRGDSPDTVKLIHERLKHRLPRWEIFYDHASIRPGEEFPELLRTKVASATAVLVIIGPKWLEILKDVVSMANSGGGLIFIGLNDDGLPSGFDVTGACEIDPATFTNKIYSYTN